MPKLPTEEELFNSQSKILDKKCKEVFNPKAEEQRIRLARKATQFYKGKDHPVFGKHIGSIPMNEYYALNKKYGIGFSNDKEFLKYLNNKVLMPNGMAANKI
jgi:hypothetical protein|tara:strand:+ start:595 stop:900 length:306 start_codon:yes stop_codon:yes gene_type:complete